MEKIISKYAYVYKNHNNNTFDIRLKENLPELSSSYPEVFENITLSFIGSMLIFEGTKLLCHYNSIDQDIWINDLKGAPFPMDESIIKFGYKSKTDKYRDIKSKYISRQTTYLYGRELRKFITPNFVIYFEVNVNEGSTFKKFIENYETI